MTTTIRRRNDNRERVIEGVLDTIAEHGVEGLTHRRVAAAAGVPLSSTTYYFATLEEMLEIAMRTATERDIAGIRERFAGASPAEVKQLLADYVIDALRSGGREVAVVVELYTAAARREGLRRVVMAWEDMWTDALAPTFGPAAEAVSAAIGGAVSRARVYGDERSPEATAASVFALIDHVPVPAVTP